MSLISKVRTIVSADRKRLKVDNLDLDLSYITPNLLAMSFPGSGIEATWRNSINDVCTLLNKKHNGKFMIWNLCERGYDYSKFNNQILDFPFPDHHAPSLNLLFEIVNSLDNWLKANPENVAVVHCKGGKGRTGTIICCYLYYSCYFDTMEESLKHFAVQRSHKHKGVTQPSQQRYINYFQEIVSGNFMIDVFSLNLVSIEMAPLTKEQAYSMSLEIFEHEKEANLSFASSPASLQVTAINEEKNQYKLNVIIGKRFIKDVLIRVYKGASGKKSSMKKQLFHLIFNISFIKLNENNRIIFGKKDLDHFKKAQKKFDENFYIECIFQNNCTQMPDHSFQIWNIMSVKYQQLKKMKKEGQLLQEQLTTTQQIQPDKENNDDVESLSSETSSSSSSTTSSHSSTEGVPSSISSNSLNDVLNNNNQQQQQPQITTITTSNSSNNLKVSTSSLSDSSSTNLNNNNNNNDNSSSSSTPTFTSPPPIIIANGNGTVSKGASPINYRESRMVSVDEIKQMILSFDISNPETSNSSVNSTPSPTSPNQSTTTIITSTTPTVITSATPTIITSTAPTTTNNTTITTTTTTTTINTSGNNDTFLNNPKPAHPHSMPNFNGCWTPKLPTTPKRLSVHSPTSSHRLTNSDGFIGITNNIGSNSGGSTPTKIENHLTQSTPEPSTITINIENT